MITKNFLSQDQRHWTCQAMITVRRKHQLSLCLVSYEQRLQHLPKSWSVEALKLISGEAQTNVPGLGPGRGSSHVPLGNTS